MAASRTLGAIGDAQAVAALIGALGDEHGTVREAAAEALGAIGDAQAVEPLIGALRDTFGWVRGTAADALDRLAWSPDQGEAGASYWAAKREWGKCVQIGALAVRPLIAALGVWDSTADAIRTLGKIGDARAVAPLMAILSSREDLDWYANWAAGDALVAIGDPAVTPLIAALKHRDRITRMRAAEALGKIGDARAIQPLLAALKDEAEEVRKAAAEGLVTIYRSGRLDDAQRATLLEQRGVITRSHHDFADLCGGHEDEARHIAFPV